MLYLSNLNKIYYLHLKTQTHSSLETCWGCMFFFCGSEIYLHDRDNIAALL